MRSTLTHRSPPTVIKDGKPVPREHEYIVVGDINSRVLYSTFYWNDAKRRANEYRRAGGQVTVFKATKG